jgi:hypothetical protein
MAKFRLNRRSVIKGAGSIAIALPWLEIMGSGKKAHALAATPAKRFLGIYTPGGTEISKWRPTGTETAPVLSPILKPLEAVKSKLLVVDGLNMTSAIGEQHQAGIIAWLTGQPQGTANAFPRKGPSIDQVIASKIAGTRQIKSLQLAVRWATGKSKGLLHPINSANFELQSPYAPIPPRLDPQEIWQTLFGSAVSTPTEVNGAALRIERRRSILDFVDKRYASLSARLGAADRQKLEQHLTKIREIEAGLVVPTTPTTSTCKAPVRVDTADYNPKSGLMSSDTGSIIDASSDAAIPKVGKFMTDMMVMALACDITAVGTLQWTDTEAKHTFPWLNLPQHHHFYQHDGGYRPVECERINTWYSEQHAYLLGEMDKIDMGGHTLLDESVVFFGSEISKPDSHGKTNMPFLLAGRGGGLRSGRWVRYSGTSHNNLLVSIMNLFGDPTKTFGDPAHCTGPLTNIV